MTQRRRSKKTEVEPRRFGRRSFLLGAGAAACVGAGLWLRRKELSERDKTEKQQQNVNNPALPAGEWRAVWISYLEWALLDFPRQTPSAPGAHRCWTIVRALG